MATRRRQEKTRDKKFVITTITSDTTYRVTSLILTDRNHRIAVNTEIPEHPRKNRLGSAIGDTKQTWPVASGSEPQRAVGSDRIATTTVTMQVAAHAHVLWCQRHRDLTVALPNNTDFSAVTRARLQPVEQSVASSDRVHGHLVVSYLTSGQGQGRRRYHSTIGTYNRPHFDRAT